MKKFFLIIYMVLVGMSLPVVAAHTSGSIKTQNVSFTKNAGELIVNMNLVLDSLRLKSNQQLFVTPYIENGDQKQRVVLPTYVFSGRGMHYVYLRSGKTLASGKTRYDIAREIYVHKGESMSVEYTQRTSLEPWMLKKDAKLNLSIDTCGCGRIKGRHEDTIPMNLMPVERLFVVPFPRPVPEIPTISYHHGKARVEFEVSKYQLHEGIYSYIHSTTGRKHVIDNRAELQVIDDSIHYALSNPNVEIDMIKVCGYASPESPYDNNVMLATNRSRVLAEYIARKYSLPQERCTFDAVPENWAGFREMTVADSTITEQQRKDLLALIDRPAYGPADYDGKETELKTAKKFAQLYKTKIHPDWFPKLRYTDFTIQTRLKSMTLPQLHEVLKTNPELLSLNQIYTVAIDCEHGSEEFQRAMEVALQRFPEDSTANCNAAALAVERKDFDKAEKYLQKAGDSDEANILRGIIEANRENYDKALEYFEKAKNTPEAARNIQLLK